MIHMISYVSHTFVRKILIDLLVYSKLCNFIKKFAIYSQLFFLNHIFVKMYHSLSHKYFLLIKLNPVQLLLITESSRNRFSK